MTSTCSFTEKNITQERGKTSAQHGEHRNSLSRLEEKEWEDLTYIKRKRSQFVIVCCVISLFIVCSLTEYLYLSYELNICICPMNNKNVIV